MLDMKNSLCQLWAYGARDAAVAFGTVSRSGVSVRTYSAWVWFVWGFLGGGGGGRRLSADSRFGLRTTVHTYGAKLGTDGLLFRRS